MVAARLRHDRPAGRLLAVDGVGRRKSVLREVGQRPAPIATRWSVLISAVGAANARNSLSTKLPCSVRPGPRPPSESCASASTRKPVMSLAKSVLADDRHLVDLADSCRVTRYEPSESSFNSAPAVDFGARPARRDETRAALRRPISIATPTPAARRPSRPALWPALGSNFASFRSASSVSWFHLSSASPTSGTSVSVSSPLLKNAKSW